MVWQTLKENEIKMVCTCLHNWVTFSYLINDTTQVCKIRPRRSKTHMALFLRKNLVFSEKD